LISVSITINGEVVDAIIEERTLLLDFVRDTAGLMGARNGCYEARCGCCSMLLDRAVVKSCNVLALQAHGREVTTVESLTPVGSRPIDDPTPQRSTGTHQPIHARGIALERLHPLQAAFHRRGALQCGFCTAGMLIVLDEYLSRTPQPTEGGVRKALRGNLCRCTGYQSIVDAALDAADAYVVQAEANGHP
jgi:aerobic carbon-monoxide dehydrogenase small subunit